jgi:hypothetical protein
MTKTMQTLISRASEQGGRGVVYHGTEQGIRGGRSTFGTREIQALNKMELEGIVRVSERRSSYDSKGGNGSWTYTTVFHII